MNGNYSEAHKAAEMLAGHVGPMVKDIPPLEGFMTVPIAVEVRFQKWDQIMAMPQPPAAMQTTTVFWHFARGMALAAKGKVAEAEAEHHIVSEAADKTPPDQVFAMPVNNKAKDVLNIADKRFWEQRSRRPSMIQLAPFPLLRRAVAIQDTL